MVRLPRLYVSEGVRPGPLVLGREQARRLTKVLRLREGDTFLAFAGDGREYEATIERVSGATVQAAVGAVTRQEAPPAVAVAVWCGNVRANRMEWALEKCVEASADAFRPLTSEHAARGEGPSKQRGERWERIAIEAAEQCGRLHLPLIEPAATLDELLRRHHGALLLAHPGGRPWRETAPLLPERGSLAIAVGPEGGFSDDEAARARAAGALVTSLGPAILRTETAAVVATALVRAWLG